MSDALLPAGRRGRALSLGLIVLLALGARASTADDAAKTAQPSSLEQFLEAPSAESWSALQDSARAGRFERTNPVVALVVRYHDAREKRDLPNSMALSGISPDEFVRRQALECDAALERLRAGRREDLWPLLRVMASQSFDELLVFTAAEIAARLGPDRFEELERVARQAAPAAEPVFERTRDRWLRPRPDAPSE